MRAPNFLQGRAIANRSTIPKTKDAQLQGAGAAQELTRPAGAVSQPTPIGTARRTEVPFTLMRHEKGPIMGTEDNPVFPERGAAAILGLSSELLKKWRYRGIGPNYIQYGPNGPVRYALKDLSVFRVEHTIKTKPMRKIIEVQKPSTARHTRRK